MTDSARIVGVTSPAPRDAWRALLEEDPRAPASQTPEWLDAVCTVTHGKDASRLYELAGGRRLVLPLVRSAWLPGPLRVESSQPHGWGVGGLLAGADPVTAAEVAAVVDHLRRAAALRLTLRPRSYDAAAYEQALGTAAGVVRSHHREQVLDLTGGFDQVWTQRFTGKVRRAVRKAESSPLVVEHDVAGRLVPEFYALYEASLMRWAKQQNEPLALARLRARRRDPAEKFAVVADRLGSRLHTWLARVDGAPAAAVLVLEQGRTATYWRGAMDIDLAGPHRANDLLHRLAIEDACRSGCTSYAMGDSGSSENLTRFKESFGAVSRDYWSYRFERLPLSSWDASARRFAKRVIGFRDT